MLSSKERERKEGRKRKKDTSIARIRMKKCSALPPSHKDHARVLNIYMEHQLFQK
jgi:hypothetical protein